MLLFLWAGRRDWRAGAILAGVVGGYLPWFFFQHRTIFSFYAVAFVPFLVLAVTMCLGLVLGGPATHPRCAASGARRPPVPTCCSPSPTSPGCCRCSRAEIIPYADWARRMWWKSWI